MLLGYLKRDPPFSRVVRDRTKKAQVNMATMVSNLVSNSVSVNAASFVRDASCHSAITNFDTNILGNCFCRKIADFAWNLNEIRRQRRCLVHVDLLFVHFHDRTPQVLPSRERPLAAIQKMRSLYYVWLFVYPSFELWKYPTKRRRRAAASKEWSE